MTLITTICRSLCMEYLRLDVHSLTGRVSVDPNIANMVRVVAGAGVSIGHVTMAFLDAHPEALAQALGAA